MLSPTDAAPFPLPVTCSNSPFLPRTSMLSFYTTFPEGSYRENSPPHPDSFNDHEPRPHMNHPSISSARASDLGAFKTIFACGKKPRFGPAFDVEAKPHIDAGLRNLGTLAMGAGCFKGGTVGSRGLKLEKDSGGLDLFDEAAVGERNGGLMPEHLVIMVNGIVGSAEDWKYGAQQFVKKLPDRVIVHRSECNYLKLTFDGVDLMGERLAKEVLSVVDNRPGVKKISFLAHSLGGLVARYAIGRLYENIPTPESSSGTSAFPGQETKKGSAHTARIAGLEPMNFITVATPHLGSRGHKQLPILCGLPFLERTAPQAAHLIAGRSGKHLFLTDEDDVNGPLLLRMVYDSEDLKFMSALCAFKRRVAYANVNYDYAVGWATSSIRRQHELPKSTLFVGDKKYRHIVHVDRETSEDIEKRISTATARQTMDLEEEMIKGLTQVPWERVDVSFRRSHQRINAHNTILVQSNWLTDGAEVVSHMIENFLL
ncbi:hypothetical protein MLD38_015260 [Melastoma candidum]|uniref:Uncharacterized protein n=1 Tax=Melastoma candidum TaxID=119954 RepID=A0ACB9REU4_9MYRT|nr:hypothetical protein MLD38_015260 [Melastoma candidum]